MWTSVNPWLPTSCTAARPRPNASATNGCSSARTSAGTIGAFTAVAASSPCTSHNSPVKEDRFTFNFLNASQNSILIRHRRWFHQQSEAPKNARKSVTPQRRSSCCRNLPCAPFKRTKVEQFHPPGRKGVGQRSPAAVQSFLTACRATEQLMKLTTRRFMFTKKAAKAP